MRPSIHLRLQCHIQSNEREIVNLGLLRLKVLRLDTNHVLGNVVNGDDFLVVPKEFKWGWGAQHKVELFQLLTAVGSPNSLL